MAASVDLPDPSSRLAAAFTAAAKRMQGLPIVNPLLAVEAVGFAPWQEHWLGVMLTPWCMNLALLPRVEAAWQPLVPGAKRHYRFPAGEYEFIGADMAELGPLQTCSLFSPVLEFGDHDTARQVAVLARAALFREEAVEPARGQRAAAGAELPASAGPIASLQGKLHAPLSKRNFLRGAFLRRDDVDRR